MKFVRSARRVRSKAPRPCPARRSGTEPARRSGTAPSGDASGLRNGAGTARRACGPGRRVRARRTPRPELGGRRARPRPRPPRCRRRSCTWWITLAPTPMAVARADARRSRRRARRARGSRSRRARSRGRSRSSVPRSTPSPTVQPLLTTDPARRIDPLPTTASRATIAAACTAEIAEQARFRRERRVRADRPRVALSPIATTKSSALARRRARGELVVGADAPGTPPTSVADREVAVEHADDPVSTPRASIASITWRPWSEPADHQDRGSSTRDPAERLHGRVTGRRHARARSPPAAPSARGSRRRGASIGGRRTRRRARTSPPT